MRKYFLHELKKHAWLLVVLSVVCSIPYIVNAATMALYIEYENSGITYRYIQDPGLVNAYVPLLILLFAVPMLVYSFKMSKRGVDGYYSLPLKREKLYFVATLVGLILVLVPYTVSFWSGFVTLLLREGNPYKMGYYVPAYFGGLCFGFFLYGVNAFVYTRANRMLDGVVYMLFYAFVGGLVMEFIENSFDDYWGYFNSSISVSFIFGGGMFEFVEAMSQLIEGYEGRFHYAGWWFGVTIMVGIVCFALFFLLIRYEKGENAEQNSDSWFGYRILIPVYVALSLGIGAGEDPFGFVMVLIAGFVATVVYQRKFSKKLANWAPLATGFVVGIILTILFR